MCLLTSSQPYWEPICWSNISLDWSKRQDIPHSESFPVLIPLFIYSQQRIVISSYEKSFAMRLFQKSNFSSEILQTNSRLGIEQYHGLPHLVCNKLLQKSGKANLERELHPDVWMKECIFPQNILRESKQLKQLTENLNCLNWILSGSLKGGV